MSGTSYKGKAPVPSLSFADKAKLQMRRPTPDSDVLASSDDDHEHIIKTVRPNTANQYTGARRSSISTHWMQDISKAPQQRKPSMSGSQPTTPALELPQLARPGTSAFPWNTTSFTATQPGTRLKEVSLQSPTSAQPGDKPLPSPTNIEADDGIGFLLNQNSPIRKSVRSQSYSVGQADIENSPLGQFSASRIRTSLRHRPSKPSLLGDGMAGLAQLREDDIDEIESSNGSDQGVRLPVGYWERENKQALLKQAAVHNARATGSPSGQRRKTTHGLHTHGHMADYAVDELEDMNNFIEQAPKMPLTRRFSEHVDVDAFEAANNSPWASTGIPNPEAMGRRHSFATITTHSPAFHGTALHGHDEEDEELLSPRQQAPSPERFDTAAYFTGHGPASRAINASAASAAHPDPIVHQSHATPGGNPYAVPAAFGRPGRRLFVVTFKCSRAEIYYVYDNTGLEIRAGDLVMVEGDRGCDLGQVSHADVSLDDAKRFKAEALDEHFRWLVMFSQFSLAGAANDVGMLGALARANGVPNNASRATLSSIGAAPDQDTKPKMIKRLAQQHEIAALRDKEGQEAKAKRTGAQKAADHKLPMEILDAEFQADYHKLTFYYYAETYVNFNELVTDIFKQYKIRIWMSAVNPASVVNPAGIVQLQPPSAIGPGAVLHSRRPGNQAAAVVGPGFGGAGPGARRQQEPAPAPAAADPYVPFANQLHGFAGAHPGQYGVQHWAPPFSGPYDPALLAAMQLQHLNFGGN